MAGRSGKQKEQDKSCDLSWLFFRFLFVSAEGVGGSAAEGFFLNDQFRPRHFEDFECAGEAHFVFEALCEPERLGETELLTGGAVRKLGTVDIHVLEIELGETAFLGEGDPGLAQGKVEMDTGVIDLILGLQRPYAVDGTRKVAGMTDPRYAAGGEQEQAGHSRHKQKLLHGHFLIRKKPTPKGWLAV